MSVAVQLFFGFIFGPLKSTSLNPALTGPLLWGLTKAPPDVKNRLIDVITKALPAEKLPALVKTLKWLFVLGLVRRANSTLNKWALNNWKWRVERHRWVWEKEVAVVTGGCGGIGAEIVKGLASKGVTVAIVDVVSLPVELEKNPKIHHFHCDLLSSSSVASVADEIRAALGPVSILVNNAGIAHSHTILESSPEYLQKLFGVNLFSNFYTVQAFLPDMIAQKKGQIVTIASAASFITVPGLVDYCASKAAVFSFHEGLNLELQHRYSAPYIITTSVHPTYVQTPLVKSWTNSLASSKQLVLTPKDVANRVVKQLLSLQGGQIIIPEVNSNIPSVRGWPNWLQAIIRDGTKDHCSTNKA